MRDRQTDNCPPKAEARGSNPLGCASFPKHSDDPRSSNGSRYVAKARHFIHLWNLARYLRKKSLRKCHGNLLRRKSDGKLWVAGHPGHPTFTPGFHFHRVREWNGLLFASPNVVWSFQDGNLFDFEGRHLLWPFYELERRPTQ